MSRPYTEADREAQRNRIQLDGYIDRYGDETGHDKQKMKIEDL